jgi:hypothetical protein
MPDASFGDTEITNPLGHEQQRRRERGRHRGPRRRPRVVPIAVAAASVLGVGSAAAGAGWFLVPRTDLPTATDLQPLHSLVDPGSSEDDWVVRARATSSSSTGTQPTAPLASGITRTSAPKAQTGGSDEADEPSPETKAERTTLPRSTPTVPEPGSGERTASPDPEPTSPEPTSPDPTSPDPSPEPTSPEPTATEGSPSPEPSPTSPSPTAEPTSPTPTTTATPTPTSSPTSPLPDLPLPDLPLPDVPGSDLLGADLS